MLGHRKLTDLYTCSGPPDGWADLQGWDRRAKAAKLQILQL